MALSSSCAVRRQGGVEASKPWFRANVTNGSFAERWKQARCAMYSNQNGRSVQATEPATTLLHCRRRRTQGNVTSCRGRRPADVAVAPAFRMSSRARAWQPAHQRAAADDKDPQSTPSESGWPPADRSKWTANATLDSHSACARYTGLALGSSCDR